MKAKKTKIFTAACCAALVLVCGALLTTGIIGKQAVGKTQDETVSPDIVMESGNFFVKAFAEGDDKNSQELSAELKKINKDNPLIVKSDASGNARSLAADHIALEILGEDIESYSVKCENGSLYFYVFRNKTDFRLTEKNVSPDGNFFEYFALDRELYDLPADEGEINRGTYLFWLPDFEKINEGDISYEEKCELLQSAEDYNKYFGDTITVSVTYKDGRTEEAEIEIIYDDDAYAYASISSIPEELIMR